MLQDVHPVALPYVGPACQDTGPRQQDRGTIKTAQFRFLFFKEDAWELPYNILADIRSAEFSPKATPS